MTPPGETPLNPLKALATFGQSFWYDNIRRGLLHSGELKRMIEEDGCRGVTSNPTIFEKAIAGSTDYDDAIRELAGKRRSVKDIFDALAVKDIQMAADLFGPVYESSGGADGFVSIEVAPSYAHDAEGTVAEARRLWKLVDRPNAMIKIPATKEGLPAVEQCLAEGINVNITLIFSIERYQQVVHAYRGALEKRARAGKPLDAVASVASFFVSRIDTAVDALLQQRIQSSTSAREKDALLELLGKVAVANAKAAYQVYKENFTAVWFEALRRKGARVQRPLWASTGTKNPNYSDVLYVEELVGPDTVNTMPPAAIAAFRDHGRPRASLEENAAGARETLDRLKAVGVDLAKVTAQLEAEGEKAFADSYEKLLQCLTAKREMIQAGARDRQTIRAGRLDAVVEAEVDRLDKEKCSERLWARDPALWNADPSAAAAIRNRLGWLDLATAMAEPAQKLKAFAADVQKAGFTHAVLLGMGGSSLCPEVLRRTFGAPKAPLVFHVLDTTDPGAILGVESRVALEKTLFLVSSKSGGTIEVTSLFRYFFAKVQAVKKDRAGENFVAITDPGTPLEKLAREKRFRTVFSTPPDVGGRFSALTYFGLVPAALIGIDVPAFLDRAERMASGCASCVPPRDNPGVRLGAALGALGRAGRDKVTFLVSPEIASFGAWAEQLIAESTGKQGKGLVPVDGEDPAAPALYGGDRVFVSLRLDGTADASLDARVDALEAAGHPVVRIALGDRLDLAQEFLRWEIAVAVAGATLGINPFDEPNVTESKDNTARLLQRFRADGKLPEDPPLIEVDGLRLWADPRTAQSLRSRGAGGWGEILAAHLAQTPAAGYVGLLAYVTPSDENHRALQRLRHRARELTRAAATLGYGPRYLHSTGQLHKGGADNGVFLQFTATDPADPAVPEEPYGFSTLKRAQALGDFQSLEAHGRRVVRVQLTARVSDDLDRLAAALDRVKISA